MKELIIQVDDPSERVWDGSPKTFEIKELVRCRYCKHWRKLLLNHNGDGACHADNPIRVSNQNWFCADGIAKDIIPDKKDGETDG